MHKHAKGENRDTTFIHCQNHSASNLIGLLTETIREQLLSTFTDTFTIPAPKLPSVHAFPNCLPADEQFSLAAQSTYSSFSSPFFIFKINIDETRPIVKRSGN